MSIFFIPPKKLWKIFNVKIKKVLQIIIIIPPEVDNNNNRWKKVVKKKKKKQNTLYIIKNKNSRSMR